MIPMSLLLESTIKTSLIVALAVAAAWLLRRQSAASRHSLLATALVCAAAMPALELMVPAWRLGSSSQPASRVAETEDSTVAVLTTEEARVPEPITASEASATASAATGLSRALSRLASWIWIAGAAFSLFMLLVGLLRLGWIARRSRPVVSGRWARLASEIARDYALRRPVALLQSDHPSLLVTWGLICPKVVLPRTAQDWTDDRIRVVLRHELAHIHRGDWAAQIAAELLRSVYWFNPLMWIAGRRLREESEQACDDLVLRRGVQGADYAEHLLALARALKSDSRIHVPAAAIAHPSSLERRITAMLNARLNRTPASRWTRLATASMLFTIAAVIASAQTGSVTLSGTVLDPSGAPVPDATVVLTNARTGAKHEVRSDAAGRYEFVPLPADTYALEARVPAFMTRKDSVSLAGQTMRRDLALTLGTLQETVTVGAPTTLTLVRDGLATTIAADKIKVGVTGKVDVRVKGTAKVKSEEPVIRDRSAFQRDLGACENSPAGGRVRPPMKIKDVRPEYPDHLREAGIGGAVVLESRIGTDGTVKDVQVIEPVHPELAAAAVEAVRQWQFDGTLLNCSPVEVVMKVTVNFGPR